MSEKVVKSNKGLGNFANAIASSVNPDWKFSEKEIKSMNDKFGVVVYTYFQEKPCSKKEGTKGKVSFGSDSDIPEELENIAFNPELLEGMKKKELKETISQVVKMREQKVYAPRKGKGGKSVKKEPKEGVEEVIGNTDGFCWSYQPDVVVEFNGPDLVRLELTVKNATGSEFKVLLRGEIKPFLVGQKADVDKDGKITISGKPRINGRITCNTPCKNDYISAIARLKFSLKAELKAGQTVPGTDKPLAEFNLDAITTGSIEAINFTHYSDKAPVIN